MSARFMTEKGKMGRKIQSMTKPETVLSRKLLKPPVKIKIKAKTRRLFDCFMALVSQRNRVSSNMAERTISRGVGMSARNRLGFF